MWPPQTSAGALRVIISLEYAMNICLWSDICNDPKIAIAW